MTQKHFFEKNIPIIKEQKDISYKVCDGVIITFKSINEKKFSLFLNGYEIERNQNYSDWSIKCAFLSVSRNMRSYQWYPLSDRKTYLIDRKIELPNKVTWEDVEILERENTIC